MRVFFKAWITQERYATPIGRQLNYVIFDLADDSASADDLQPAQGWQLLNDRPMSIKRVTDNLSDS